MADLAQPITVPDQPTFFLSDIAILLDKPKQTVDYWMTHGKLASKKDFRGREYVERPELLRFITEYLRLQFV